MLGVLGELSKPVAAELITPKQESKRAKTRWRRPTEKDRKRGTGRRREKAGSSATPTSSKLFVSLDVPHNPVDSAVGVHRCKRRDDDLLAV